MSQEYEIKTYGTAKVVLEAGEYTVKDLIGIIEGMGQLNRHNRAPIDAVTLSSDPSGLRQRKAQPEQCQCPNCKVTLHASDCAVHNEPAYPKGRCDCGAQPEQEPMHPELRKMWEDYFDKCFRRQPLTDKQILADETLRYYFGQNGGAGPVSKQGRKVVNAIEALHEIKEVKSCGS